VSFKKEYIPVLHWKAFGCPVTGVISAENAGMTETTVLHGTKSMTWHSTDNDL